ncbi:MAG: tRNA pseudouridine(38-40) synthase TruA [Thermodesulfobacteriota bacterium]
MRQIKLIIEYDGTNYHGWQMQPHVPTIQEEISKKISQMTGEQVTLLGAGRTDAGVHAWGQVACFKTNSQIPLEGFYRGLNSLLPPDIVIKAVEEVAENFHPQFSSRSKIYQYVILNQKFPSAIHRHFSWHIPFPLDVPTMQKAADCLIGRKDFSAFQAADDEPSHPVREILRAQWSVRAEVFLDFFIEADGFLKHMVRNIVGTLVDVGRGKISVADFQKIIEAKDRRRAGMTAPPQGLFLVAIKYD